MTFLFGFLFVLTIAAIVGVMVWRSNHQTKLSKVRERAKEQDYSDEKIDAIIADNQFPLPANTSKWLAIPAGLFLIAAMFNSVAFFAEPGYTYHVRLLTGLGGILKQERVVSGSTGYSLKLFGRVTAWKNEMSVQASEDSSGMNTGSEGTTMSANLPPFKLVMLDQVSALVKATTRFSIPTEEVAFLKMAHKYRTPDNLLRTSLIPQFQETLKATSALMTAEEYYSGGITEFQNEFENQMISGIFVVKRVEVLVKTVRKATSSANASKVKQDEYGEGDKVIFVVKKVLDENGQPIIKKSKLTRLGILVVEARVTDLEPNPEFVARMKLKQKASADRAIAREQRIQEEEQKLLVRARGARLVAERQAKAKVEQIQKTTDAETEKQLAITAAEKLLASATIEKKTAAQAFLRDKIIAKSVRVLADAKAYKRRKLIMSDNGLKIKTAAIVQMNKDNAAAYAKRAVPNTVIYSGGTSKGGMGSDGDMATLVQSQLIKNLKSLDLDMSIRK